LKRIDSQRSILGEDVQILSKEVSVGTPRGLVLTLSFCLVSASAFAADLSASIVDGRETTVPIGHVGFCARSPEWCRNLDPKTSPEHLTPAMFALVTKVNADVNREVRPVSDKDMWGVEERWSVARDRGDCEDYSLLKAQRLISAGLHPENLLVAVVRNRGEGHAVLTVRTDAGDYVLDNLSYDVKTWNLSGYRFVKRQKVGMPSRWVSIGSSETAVVASTR
jgi:predicted transglutaminase-like cysteine proteinase